jgi:hypothetical protein
MLTIALLLLGCLAFSLWLNFRLAKLVIFYGNVPRRSGYFCSKGVEFMWFPVVPLLLVPMARHHIKSPLNPTPRELRRLMCV